MIGRLDPIETDELRKMKRGHYKERATEAPKRVTEADIRRALADAFGEDIAAGFTIKPIGDDPKKKK